MDKRETKNTVLAIVSIIVGLISIYNSAFFFTTLTLIIAYLAFDFLSDILLRINKIEESIKKLDERTSINSQLIAMKAEILDLQKRCKR